MRYATGLLDRLLGLAQFDFMARHRDDRGSMRCQMEGRSPAQASPRSGDHGHFALQGNVHFDFESAFFLGLPAAVSK